jgi:hypothetical protein
VDVVGIDEQPVARFQLMRAAANEPLAGRVDEHAVGAGVFDEERTLLERDAGVASRHLGVRQHPVAGARPPDDAPIGPELAPAVGPQTGRVSAAYFQGQDHLEAYPFLRVYRTPVGSRDTLLVVRSG